MDFLARYKYVIDAVLVMALIAGALFGVHKYNAYQQDIGAARVQALWDADKALRAEQALSAEQTNRAKEQAFHTSLENLTNDYIRQKAVHAAAVVASGNSLRDLQAQLAAADRAAAADPAATVRADDAARARAVVAECANALSKVAEAADTLETRLTALQSYVKDVVQKQ